MFASLLVVALVGSALAQPRSAPRSPRHFVDISDGLPDDLITAVAVDPGDPEVLFAGLDGFVFKSVDGGKTWRPVLSFPRGLSVDAEAALGAAEAAGDLDGLGGLALPDLDGDLDLDGEAGRLASDLALRDLEDLEDLQDLDDIQDIEDLDDLQDYEDLEDLHDFEDLDDLVDDAARREAIVEDGLRGEADALFEALPAGDADLRAIFPRQEAGVRAIRFGGPSSRALYVATPRGLFRSADNGETFREIQLPGGALANDVRGIAVDPLTPGRLHVATADGTFTSVDGAATFRRAPDLLGTTPALAILAKRVNDQDMVLVGTERGLWRSWDGGATFREMLLQGVSALESVGAVAFDERTGITYAGTVRGLFAGEREASLLEPRRALFGEPVYAISIDPRRDRGVAVGMGERGVVQSDDTGITLVDVPDALPARNAFDLARPSDEPAALLVASERGVFSFIKGEGPRVTEDRLRQLVEAFQREPSMQETAVAALRYARLDGPLADISTRARLAPLLPELSLRYRYWSGRPDRDQYVVVLDEQDALDETDTEELLDLARDGILIDAPTRGIFWDVFAFARWNLDEIIFNPAELQAAGELPTLHRARERVLNRVETLYTARQRLMAEMYLAGAAPRPSVRAKQLLRLAELTALLSGITGGAFVELAEARGVSVDELTGAAERATLPNPRRR